VAQRHSDETVTAALRDELRRERAETVRLHDRIDALMRGMASREDAARSLAVALDDDATVVAREKRRADEMARRAQAAEEDVCSLRAALEAAAADASRLRRALADRGVDVSPPAVGATGSVAAGACSPVVGAAAGRSHGPMRESHDVAALQALVNEKDALQALTAEQVTCRHPAFPRTTSKGAHCTLHRPAIFLLHASNRPTPARCRRP
jgi:hypothetical protein